MRTTRSLAAAAALAAVAGLVVSLVALAGWQRSASRIESSPVPSVAGTTAAPAPAPPTGPAERVRRSPAGLDRSAGPDRIRRPVRLTIADAEIDMPVRRVGVADDGQMALPEDPTVLGWYRFGPAPGARAGSAVLAGHLDTVADGVGPLVRLREVSPGDPIRVTSADGVVRRYRVVAVDRYDRQALPAELFARTGVERLRVVTCGGAYVPGQGYEQNLVVTARPA